MRQRTLIFMAQNISISMFVPVFFCPSCPTGSMRREGLDRRLHMQWVASQERNIELGEPTVLQRTTSRPALCPGGRHFLFPPSGSVYAHLENAPGEGGQGLAFFVSQTCRRVKWKNVSHQYPPLFFYPLQSWLIFTWI